MTVNANNLTIDHIILINIKQIWLFSCTTRFTHQLCIITLECRELMMKAKNKLYTFQ